MPMYNLIEYSSIYSETTECLWFYSKEEAIDFNANIANTSDFKSHIYKARLVENKADGADGILKNATNAVPLKYLSNFWGSFEMSLIDCKVELKIKSTKYCVLSAAGVDSINGNANDNIFTIKVAKLNVPVVLSQQETIKNYQNFLLVKDLKDQFIEINIKPDVRVKQQMNKDIFESNFVGVNRLYVLVYLNRGDDVKQFKTQ